MKSVFLLFTLLFTVVSFAQTYSIDWHKISGGGGTSVNGQFTVSGTIGQSDAAGAISGGKYSLTGGFWSLISVVRTTGAPTLTIARSGNNLIISWPSTATDYVLQQNSNLADGSWTTSGYTISDDETNKSITIVSPTGNLFFRLKQP